MISSCRVLSDWHQGEVLSITNLLVSCLGLSVLLVRNLHQWGLRPVQQLECGNLSVFSGTLGVSEGIALWMTYCLSETAGFIWLNNSVLFLTFTFLVSVLPFEASLMCCVGVLVAQ